MPGRRCLGCVCVDDLIDGEVLRELTRSLLGVEAVFHAAPDGDAAFACLSTLVRSGLISFSLEEVSDLAAGWRAGDATATVLVLHAVKDALANAVASKDRTLSARSRVTNDTRNSEITSARRPVSALERLSGDRGLFDFDEVGDDETTCLPGQRVDTLRRLAGDLGQEGGFENLPEQKRKDSEAGSFKDWGSDGEHRTTGETDVVRRVSHASAYAAAANAAEAAALAYATRAEEARVARSAFLDDEARVAAMGAVSRSRARLSTSPGANDTAGTRSFKGGAPAPNDTEYLPTPKQTMQTFANRNGASTTSRLTPTQQDVVVWILGLGLDIHGACLTGDTVTSLPRATAVTSEIAKGALLCRLVETLEGVHLGEVYLKPKVKQEATHNLNKALAVLRKRGRVYNTFLWSAGSLAAGDGNSAWGLLGDIRAAYDAAVASSSPTRTGKQSAHKKVAMDSAKLGRVKGRALRVTPRVDARGGASNLGDPFDIRARGGGEGRLPQTPARQSASPAKQSRRFTPHATRPFEVTEVTTHNSQWRRAAPGTTLTSRGYPSPVAKAAAKVLAARAKRVARLFGFAEKAEKNARVRKLVAGDAAQSASRAAFEAAAAEAEAAAEHERLEEEQALEALEWAAEMEARHYAARKEMVPGAVGARFSRGGAVKGALSADVERGARSVQNARPTFNNSGYISPNEGGRRRSVGLSLEGGFGGAVAKNAFNREKEKSKSPATAAQRGLSFTGTETDLSFSFSKSVGQQMTGGRAVKTQVGLDLVRQVTTSIKTPVRNPGDLSQTNKTNEIALAAARTAALAGAFPVVFEYREQPLPVPPHALDRDEEVRNWLATLRLSVLPREEHFPLLSNPTRNGVLLCDVMTVLVGAPGLTSRERRPRTLDQARVNVEKALAPLRTIPGAVPPGLTWSTEGVLKGSREHTFGLLWYVKRAALVRVAGVAKLADETLVDNFGAHPTATPDSRNGGFARASTPLPARVGAGKQLAFTGEDEKGSDVHYTGVPTTTGNLKHRVARSSGANREAPQTVGETASKYGSPDSLGAVPSSFETEQTGTSTQLLGYEALPAYSMESIKRLETSLVRWLVDMGLLPLDATRKAFVALCPEIARGTILCDLVTAIEGVPVVGVFRHPKSFKTAEANAKRACERLARHRSMSRKFLWRTGEVAAGNAGVLLGLLEDVRVFYDRLPPRNSGTKKWNLQLPYTPEINQVGVNAPMGPPTVTRTMPPASPSRLLGGDRFVDRRSGREVGESESDDDDASSEDSNPPALSAEPSLETFPTRLGGSVRVSPVKEQKRESTTGAKSGADKRSADKNSATAKSTVRKSSTHKSRGVSSTKQNSVPLSPRVADRPEQAARTAAVALDWWSGSLTKDLGYARNPSPGFKPSIPNVSIDAFRGTGGFGRANAWELGSFPNVKTTPREVERYRQSVSKQHAAETIVGSYYESGVKTPTLAKSSFVGIASTLSTAQRARAVERARKHAAVSHARDVSRTKIRPTPEDSALLAGGFSAPRSQAAKPPRSGRSVDASRAPRTPSAPPSALISKQTAASPNRLRRPVRFVDPISPAQEAANARQFEATRLARWICSLGVSLRRVGASGASRKPKDSSELTDPFPDATRPPAEELAAVCADGTLLCELVRVLENKDVGGVTWRPESSAQKLHNLTKALQHLRLQPAMSPMHLWCERDILNGDTEMICGLLGDMRACTAYRRAGRRT